MVLKGFHFVKKRKTALLAYIIIIVILNRLVFVKQL